MSPAAKAGQVLMESDRPLEYSYSWDGHSPRGESECSQGAAQSLLGQLNRMSNISKFDEFTNAGMERKLNDKFEQLGELIKNDITFTENQSSAQGLTATQRGLVVSVSSEGFKPGTFGEKTEKNWKGERTSRCWGTLLYKFVIYGPDTITPKSSTSSSSSSSNTSKGNALVNGGGKCLDVHAPDMGTNGGKVQVWDCSGQPQQQWTLKDNALVNGGGKCLDVHAPDMGTNGGKVQVWDCSGQPQQQWRF
ncbi:RICIN domain-containing protein [uncultured Nostoc sp.]|uniref:RICIN domain-containing protein n=1 Tax=uncultured Nostoc sp. TaxID=340711 RepID=UPI0035CA687D